MYSIKMVLCFGRGSAHQQAFLAVGRVALEAGLGGPAGGVVVAQVAWNVVLPRARRQKALLERTITHKQEEYNYQYSKTYG